jgi:polyisoprenoid-binding protein YceI
MESVAISHRQNVNKSKGHKARWIIIGIVTVVVILVAGLYLISGSLVGPAPALLQLPQLSPATQGASTASPSGTWIAGAGSVAGFRVPESFLGQSGTIAGRTSAVTGAFVISHNEISAGSFQVDLSQLTIGGKSNASFFQIMDTSKNPDATLALTKPIVFNSIPTNGQVISAKATGSLTMHGITHAVTFTIMARSNGSVLEATGLVSLLASAWDVKSPFGLQNNDLIEFLVVLQKG